MFYIDSYLLPSDKKRIHLSGKPSEAGADAERIGIYLQRVCHRGVSFSSAPLVNVAKFAFLYRDTDREIHTMGTLIYVSIKIHVHI